MKRAVLIFSTLFILVYCTACTQDTDNGDSQAIRIAYLPITHSVVMMMMAAEKDEDAPYTIELVPFSTWPDVVDALRTGRVDGASILFEVALQARGYDDSLTMTSLSHRDGNVIVVDNTVQSYHDLIGRTVAIPHRLSPQYTLLQIVLEREEIDPESLNIIEISPAEMPFTMAGGAISAFIVAEPFGSIAESAGVGRIFETSDQIFYNSVCCVMVLRDIDHNPSQRDWFISRFEQIAEAAHRRDEHVLQVFRNHSRVSDDIIRSSFDHINFDNLSIDYHEYNNITDIILRHSVLDKVPHFADFVLPDR